MIFSGCTSSAMNQGQNFSSITPGKLIVATGTAYKPFMWINTSDSDPQGRYTGFEMDLMREIAKDLNCSVEFTSQPFSSMITAIQADQFDCAIASFSITADRQTKVSFSDPYYEVQQAIIVRADDNSINNATDLANENKIVAVNMGSTGAEEAKDVLGIKDENIRTYEHMSNAFPDLKIGAVDAIIMDYPTGRNYADSYPGSFKFVGQLLPQKEPYAIVINKENTKLTAAIDKALANIKADGRYDALLRKYNLDTVS